MFVAFSDWDSDFQNSRLVQIPMDKSLVITQILLLRQNVRKSFEISYESKGLSDSKFEVTACSSLKPRCLAIPRSTENKAFTSPLLVKCKDLGNDKQFTHRYLHIFSCSWQYKQSRRDGCAPLRRPAINPQVSTQVLKSEIYLVLENRPLAQFRITVI